MPIKVRVRNFQSVEDAELVISGLTILTGTNNAGKSAFFRALRGALVNARGTDFVRHGAQHCIVDIEDIETGQKLTWKKGGDGSNDYWVNGKHYPKVGHGVPDEARIFGVESLEASNTEIWPQIAPQITGVSFLLDQPGSVIAEAVADVDRISQLGRALKNCESERRSARGELKTRRKDGKTLAERREAFAGLDAVVEEIDKLEERRDKSEKLSRALANMVKMRNRYQQARQVVESLRGLDDVEKHIPSAQRVKDVRKVQTELAEVRQLRDARASAQAVVDELAGIAEVQQKLPSEERVNFALQFRKAIGVTVDLALRLDEARKEQERAEEVERVLSSISLDESLPKKVAQVREVIRAVRRLRDQRTRVQAELVSLDQEIVEAAEESKKASERVVELLGAHAECPTCGGTLKHDVSG